VYKSAKDGSTYSGDWRDGKRHGLFFFFLFPPARLDMCAKCLWMYAGKRQTGLYLCVFVDVCWQTHAHIRTHRSSGTLEVEENGIHTHTHTQTHTQTHTRTHTHTHTHAHTPGRSGILELVDGSPCRDEWFRGVLAVRFMPARDTSRPGSPF